VDHTRAALSTVADAMRHHSGCEGIAAALCPRRTHRPPGRRAIARMESEVDMAGFLQNTPWSYNPYTASGIPGAGPFLPQHLGGISPFGPQAMGPSSQVPPWLLQILPQQIQQLQQVVQILPQQIQQLQQTVQFLPQHIAQLVVQTLIQSQALAGAQPGQPFQSSGAGFPFSSITANPSPFQAGQPGYVM
jgi:hypothetical protein